ncbi:MAG: hypothetical protein LBI14_07555 [Treponema sp.]|jgi:hypothetical protein|nr:hypothetical protein [Treponema sp.]
MSQKAALSLLISVLLFAVFSVLAFTGLFDFFEIRFYNPSITSSLSKELNRDAQSLENYLNYLQTRFEAAVAEGSVKRSFLSNQSTEDIFNRSWYFGILQESIPGLQWIRLIDTGGVRIHYSSNAQDVTQQDRLSVSYRNYNSIPGVPPYESIASEDRGRGRLILDEDLDRVFISLPSYDSYDVFRGTALFSISTRALAEQLIREERLKAGDDISIISNPQGFLIGKPTSSGNSLSSLVASLWNDGILTLTTINSEETMALLSVKTSRGFYVGRLVSETVFSFPESMKVMLLVTFFLTVFLTVFLIFSLRQDPFVIVQNRLKQLQISLIEQYYEQKGAMDWGRWGRELGQRREEIRNELKKGIKDIEKNKKVKNDIDVLIDKSWDELLAIISGHRESSSLADKPKTSKAEAVQAEEPAEAEELDVVVEVEEVEDGKIIANARDIEDAEAVEELEEAELVEDLEEAELVEELEELEEVESEEDTNENPPDANAIESED